jgi:hypothetical protein
MLKPRVVACRTQGVAGHRQDARTRQSAWARDDFDRSEARKPERAPIGELLTTLSAEKLLQAIEITRIPEEIRGYCRAKGHRLAATGAVHGLAILGISA